MREQGVTEFSGVAGRVLQQSISAASLATGLTLGVVLLVGNWVLFTAGMDRLTMLFTQAVIALALARFALNGRYGEWGGTVFSTAGGPWSTVVQVTSRYIALAAIWLIPAMLLGMTGEAASSGMLPGPDLLMGATGLSGLAMLLTPPLFLIVAVGAEDFGELFSMAHWRRLFDGRLPDLFALYVVYVGAMMMVLLLALPLGIVFGSVSLNLGLFFAGAAACFAGGLAFSLLGRLCGFFACGEPGRFRPGETVQPDRDPAVPAVDPLAVSSAPVISAAPQPPLPGASAGGATGQPPLLDAKPHVDAALRLLARDPDGAVAALQELRSEYAPHPQVLYALFRIHHQAERIEQAVEAANAAFGPCIERGAFKPAAEMFRSLLDHVDEFELSEEQVVTIGAALFHAGDVDTAAVAYSKVLDKNPDATKAVKGMMKVADLLVHKLERASDAIDVYRYLLEQCPESPLAEFMNQGIAVAERRGDVAGDRQAS